MKVVEFTQDEIAKNKAEHEVKMAALPQLMQLSRCHAKDKERGECKIKHVEISGVELSTVKGHIDLVWSDTAKGGTFAGMPVVLEGSGTFAGTPVVLGAQ